MKKPLSDCALVYTCRRPAIVGHTLALAHCSSLALSRPRHKAQNLCIWRHSCSSCGQLRPVRLSPGSRLGYARNQVPGQDARNHHPFCLGRIEKHVRAVLDPAQPWEDGL